VYYAPNHKPTESFYGRHELLQQTRNSRHARQLRAARTLGSPPGRERRVVGLGQAIALWARGL
jgi:hypothetical protein